MQIQRSSICHNTECVQCLIRQRQSICNICSRKATVAVQVGVQVYHWDAEQEVNKGVKACLIV